jgi:tetratricopeptide (TPR) repeat protein
MSLAVRYIEQPATAAAWLDRVQPVIPSDSFGEMATLATNWFGLGERARSDAYKQKGAAMLAQLAEGDDAQPAVISSYAVMAYQMGDVKTAEAQYRRALKKEPKLYVAANNLAILIADRGGDLQEAVTLVTEVVQANPKVANFHDSLAHVYTVRKEYDQAIKALQEAIRLDPGQPEWRINLAKAHADKGDRDGAQQALREFESLRIPAERLTPELQERLQQVRQAVLSQAAASTP